MKICIVSGVFEPDSGGPATYAPRLATKLSDAGHVVTAVAYSNAPSYQTDASYPFKLIRVVRAGRILNRVRFFFAAWSAIRESNIVYMMDWFAAGVPAALASRLLGKQYLVRVGGDYLWEQKYLESGEAPMTLQDFYERGLYLRRSYRVYLWLITWVLRGASRVVFNSDEQRALYERFYGLVSASTICNPVPRTEVAGIVRGASTNEFVYWGRFIVMKNIDTLVRAFSIARIPENYHLTLIGDGPQKAHIIALVQELHLEDRVTILPGMRLMEVLERIKDARAFVLPSWTDISPNQVYEALAIGLPALVTEENYLSIRDQLPLTIDPSSADDIARKLELLVGDREYAAFVQAFRSISFEWSWDDVVQEHIRLFTSI